MLALSSPSTACWDPMLFPRPARVALISDIVSALMPCVAASDDGSEADLFRNSELFRDGPTFGDDVEAPTVAMRRRQVGTPQDVLRWVDDVSSLVFSLADPLPSSSTKATADFLRSSFHCRLPGSVRTSDHPLAAARPSAVLVFSFAAGLVLGLGTSVVLEFAFVLCSERLTSASSFGGCATRVRPARDVPNLLKELLGGEWEVDIRQAAP